MRYNIYCDETCHLLNGHDRYMVLGCVWCPKDKVKGIHERIRDIKDRNGIHPNGEVKWTRISKGNMSVYQQLIDYFFDTDDLNFRAIIIDKEELNHKEYGQTHDDWYYKMMFQLIHTILESDNNSYDIFLDYKDTLSGEKSMKLHKVLCNSQYDFSSKIITNVQCLPSHEIGLIQICDILIGAISYDRRKLDTNDGKLGIIELIRKRSHKSLMRSTLPSERKFNLFFWHGGYRY